MNFVVGIILEKGVGYLGKAKTLLAIHDQRYDSNAVQDD
jgi:hypothetical protein